MPFRFLRMGKKSNQIRKHKERLFREMVYEVFEPRVMLAGISFNSATKEVEIDGSNQSDTVRVIPATNNQILVSLTGFTSQLFSIAEVKAIRFWGRQGNDFFQNTTNLPSFAYGHAGDDTLIGGTNVDRFQGGHGKDRLEGNGGRDGLRGNIDDDLLIGGADNDYLYGGTGNDDVRGEAGDDQLSGNDGNDIVHGGLGNDFILGNAGADKLYGDNGNDRIYGGDQNDEIYGGLGADKLYGERGLDSLFGEAGADELFGGDDADRLLGGTENDIVYGGNGDDTLEGGTGNDQLNGEAGNDSLKGDDGADTLSGGDGNDTLDGGNANDKLFGGNGDDFLYGRMGDDLLKGENGNDLLRGNAGNDDLDGGGGLDGLFGGIGGSDKLNGGANGDRILTWTGHTLTNYESIDGAIQFVNMTSSWNEAEIDLLDEGLRALHERVGNGKIFRDSLDTKQVVYGKYSSLNGSAAQNSLTTRTVGGVTSYDRSINFAEWDENNTGLMNFYRFVAVHEIGHSWDSVAEINNRLPGQGTRWSSFLAASSWRSTNPNSSNYLRSGDGAWWYLKTARFARSYGTTNPYEDWSTVWEVVLDPAQSGNLAVIANKVSIVNQLWNAF